jgi:hypothetical protein
VLEEVSAVGWALERVVDLRDTIVDSLSIENSFHYSRFFDDLDDELSVESWAQASIEDLLK